MIVDEPFAYLDLDRARELWRILCEVARERQVFVVTQEALTLHALGVAPDIELTLARSSVPAGTSSSSPTLDLDLAARSQRVARAQPLAGPRGDLNGARDPVALHPARHRHRIPHRS